MLRAWGAREWETEGELSYLGGTLEEETDEDWGGVG